MSSPQGEMIDAVVAAADEVAEGIKCFNLVPAEGARFPAFEAGSHIDVHCKSGAVRQYSLLNAPGETDRYVIAVKREVPSRGGSASMHDDVSAGDRLVISEPRNNFPLDAEAPHSLLVAGGIGITPLLSMRQVLAAADRPYRMLYFGRSRASMAFIEELSASVPAECFLPVVEADPNTVVRILEREAAELTPASLVYLCGPEPFMKAARALFSAVLPSTSIRLEHFSAAADQHAGAGFEVVLADSGRTVRVGEEENIVDALARIGVQVATSCEQGICGTCVTRVLEGAIDHRDSFLTEDERLSNGEICLCVSRAKGKRLVLDL